METYLGKIGTQVHKVTELQPGDIVGWGGVQNGYEDVKICYVERVIPNPDYLKWVGPYSPYVSFKVPSVGFTVNNDTIGRIYIYTHTPSSHYKYKWSEMPLEEAIKQGFGSDEWVKEWDFRVQDECFDLYKITDESLIQLGKLIPEIEVPYWSALAQTVHGHEPIKNFVERTKGLFQLARGIYKQIEDEVRRTE